VPRKRLDSADPIDRFRRWLKAARKAGAPLAEAAALATVDSRQRPSVRYVLLKTANDDGLVFYTNCESRKGRDLAKNPHASLAFYWDATGRQVRIDGRVVKVSAAEADAYWAERPRASRIASLVSRQSAALASRAKLDAAYRTATRRYRGAEVPRPERWVGYRLVPSRIEFWTRREPRLHIREMFERAGDGWKETLLQP
jgi:pyridoxamine 5'-phosphate oxidase